MKISNSKKQLAKIIAGSGGWLEGFNFAAQDGNDLGIWAYTNLPVRSVGRLWGSGGECKHVADAEAKLPNWHQTILSRDEYFHLYPAPDADRWIEWNGGECPIDKHKIVDLRMRDGELIQEALAGLFRWSNSGSCADIIAYRQRKQGQQKSTAVGDDDTNLAAKEELEAMEYRPSIEQLTADYHSKLAIAKQAQEEADSHRCVVEAALERLYQAGFAIGLDIAIAEETEAHEPDSEPNELKISHWSDLVVGDVISLDCPGHNLPVGEYEVVEIDYNNHDNYPQPIKVMWNGSLWRPDINARKWRFIRRP